MLAKSCAARVVQVTIRGELLINRSALASRLWALKMLPPSEAQPLSTCDTAKRAACPLGQRKHFLVIYSATILMRKDLCTDLSVYCTVLLSTKDVLPYHEIVK